MPKYYKPNKLGHYEKYVVVEPEYLPSFFEAPFHYLMPDKEDVGYIADTVFASPQNMDPQVTNTDSQAFLRERYNCSYLKRVAHFRKEVFKKYEKPHCVVCGNDCVDVLEAAHIIPVNLKGLDVPENGVCLCRNHHKLFDSSRKVLKIDNNNRLFWFEDSNAIYNEKSVDGGMIQAGIKYSFY